MNFSHSIPTARFPAILDPDGPGGKPLALFESGAILQYLAEKTGQFLPADPALRWQTLQWLHFQMGGAGPMFGQVGFFHKFAGKDFQDKRPRDRYVTESKRLLGVMDAHLATHQWFAGDDYYHRGYLDAWLGAQPDRVLRCARYRRVRSFPSCRGWLERGLARPAVQRGLAIPARQ